MKNYNKKGTFDIKKKASLLRDFYKNFYTYVFVSVGGYLHTNAGAHRGQKRASDPLEQEWPSHLSSLDFFFF